MTVLACTLPNTLTVSKPARGRRRPETTRVRACLRCISTASTRSTDPSRLRQGRLTWTRGSSNHVTAAQAGQETDGESGEQGQEEEFDDVSDTLPVKIALSMLNFYKTGISPLMPPSCRFQPTCSSYAVDAYTRYGVTKGTIMTAWRLFRCTPWGDRGYDPAVWPPKGLDFLNNM